MEQNKKDSLWEKYSTCHSSENYNSIKRKHFDALMDELTTDVVNTFVNSVSKLSLVDSDLIILHVQERISNSAMLALKQALVDNGFNQFLLVLVKNDHIDKMTNDQLVKFIRGQLDNRDNTADLMKYGLVKLKDVKRLMDEAAIQCDKTTDQLINEILLDVKKLKESGND